METVMVGGNFFIRDKLYLEEYYFNSLKKSVSDFRDVNLFYTQKWFR